MSVENSVSLVAHCLCKSHTYSTSVPISKLPLPAYVCHCDSCRRVTGALYSADLRWPQPRDEVDVSRLKIFPFFPSIDLLFCGTCSSPMFFADKRDKSRQLGVFTGVLQNQAEDVLRFVEHGFVGDTKDGGASCWMRKPNADGSEAKRWRDRSVEEMGDTAEQLPDVWPSDDLLTGFDAKPYESIPIRCKCGGVDLILHGGDYSKVRSEDLPWNVDPGNHKLQADFCGCDSCRLQCGVDIFYWTFAEMKNITFSAEQRETVFPTRYPVLRELIDSSNPTVGTLAYYASSHDVTRFFCGTCSAVIFYGCDDRDDFLDVAVGVLNAPDGARAEGLLSWGYGKRVAWQKDTVGSWRHDLIKRVEKEAEEYRALRAYPKNYTRGKYEDEEIAREEKRYKELEKSK